MLQGRLAILVLASFLGGQLLLGCADSAPDRDRASEAEGALRDGEIPAFYLGTRFEGLPLTDVTERPRVSIGAIYGTCRPKGDAGCAPPVEVQTWRLGGARQELPRYVKRRQIRIRGVPAEVFVDRPEVAVFTGDVRVHIFARSQAEALRAARQLRAASASGSSAGRLPPPSGETPPG